MGTISLSVCWLRLQLSSSPDQQRVLQWLVYDALLSSEVPLQQGSEEVCNNQIII